MQLRRGRRWRLRGGIAPPVRTQNKRHIVLAALRGVNKHMTPYVCAVNILSIYINDISWM